MRARCAVMGISSPLGMKAPPTSTESMLRALSIDLSFYIAVSKPRHADHRARPVRLVPAAVAAVVGPGLLPGQGAVHVGPYARGALRALPVARGTVGGEEPGRVPPARGAARAQLPPGVAADVVREPGGAAVHLPCRRGDGAALAGVLGQLPVGERRLQASGLRSPQPLRVHVHAEGL